MDRRQRKTREAIFKAFTQLLSEKNISRITVEDIITRADIGRATFYAHFETRDYLLKELCSELFCHIFDSMNHNEGHRHIFECDAPDSAFLHLFRHLQKNDNNILELLSCGNNELFLNYFRRGIYDLVENNPEISVAGANANLPEDFLINHIVCTFVETVRWWTENGTKQSPEEITEYFMIVAGLRK